MLGRARLLLVALALLAAEVAAQGLPETSVVAVGSVACYHVDALLADTPARRSRGLMFVEAMPDNAGMLFVYRRPAVLSMWMKNTLIALDMVFADPTDPAKLLGQLQDILRADGDLAVLALNAGRAVAMGLGEGSQLIVFQRP